MDFEYNLRRDNRIKNLSLSVDALGEITVRVPFGISERKANQFVEDKKEWILASLENFNQKRQEKIDISFSKQHYIDNRKTIKKILEVRLLHFSNIMDIEFLSMSVRNQKTRWGSCSSAGRLNFNYRLGYIPPRLRDYIIVHELAHRLHMNHGMDFWLLVQRYVPDQEEIRKELRNYYFV